MGQLSHMAQRTGIPYSHGYRNAARHYAKHFEKAVSAYGILSVSYKLAECEQAEKTGYAAGSIPAGSGSWFRQCTVFPASSEPGVQREIPRRCY